MKIDRRGFLKATACSGVVAAAACVRVRHAPSRPKALDVAYSLDTKGTLRLFVPGMKESVRVFHASDTHLALHDSRDDAYAGNYARMAKWPGSTKAFSDTLAKAAAAKADLIALTGDIISFPTLANVEFVSRELEKSGLDWMYTAGNHDWHFEGVPGSDREQRAEWAPKRLAPLYRGANPLMSSKVVKGVRFVAIDDSIYHISEEQLAFWRAEAAKGEPVVLMMHIPIWAEGFGIYTCAGPSWGAATDKIWEIERREKWAERQSRESFALREDVLRTPNLVAVLTGHIHRGLNACVRGKHLFSIPQNNKGFHWDITIGPAKEDEELKS